MKSIGILAVFLGIFMGVTTPAQADSNKVLDPSFEGRYVYDNAFVEGGTQTEMFVTIYKLRDAQKVKAVAVDCDGKRIKRVKRTVKKGVDAMVFEWKKLQNLKFVKIEAIADVGSDTYAGSWKFDYELSVC